MALINDASILTQLSTLISSVTVSTEETGRLLFLLKTSQNASAVSSTIVTELLSRIDTITTSDTINELILLIKAAQLIESDKILTVPNLTTLNTYTNAIVGTILYVQDIGAPYIRKSDGTWVLIDPILQQEEKDNGYSWGNNIVGSLGNNTTVSRSSPVSVVGGFKDWVQIEAGDRHSLGLRANGTIWSWGYGASGRIGDNTAITKSSPVSVVGGFTDWVQISAGGSHSLGVRANGTLWGWGYGNYGRLGNNAVVNASSPIQPVGGIVNWVQASAGLNHSLGLAANGTLYAWGVNSLGRLGDNTVANKSSPVLVTGGFVDWTQAAAGNTHSLGIRANGTLYAWGANSYGRLGNNSTVNTSSPVLVVGGFTDWVQVSASSHNVGLRANGTIYAWGYNSQGKLGDNSSTAKSSPVLVVGGFTDWIQASAGESHSLGVRANGILYAWGSNLDGRLGDNTAVSKSSPVSIVGGLSSWIQASAGGVHSLGVKGG